MYIGIYTYDSLPWEDLKVFTKFYLPSLKSCRVEIFLFSTVDFRFLLGNREIF